MATNYAIAARWDLATQHLQAAVGLDERIRRRARTDPNFTDMAQYSPFDTLLKEDSYRAPSGAYIRSKVFDEPFDGARGKLLSAVLNALQMQIESNAGGERSGLLFRHKTDENAAIASIALVIAVLHAGLGVYTWFARRQARASLRTRQYLQLDSLAPDEYDVQRLEGEPGDF